MGSIRSGSIEGMRRAISFIDMAFVFSRYQAPGSLSE
jgi:hypothetical protein